MHKSSALALLFLTLTGCSLSPSLPAANTNGQGNVNANVSQPVNGNVNMGSGDNTNLNSSNVTNFQSNTFKFTVPQPAGCMVEEDKDGVVFTCGAEQIVVARQPEIPRIPIPEDRIENVIVSGFSAQLFHDTDQKTGADKDIVILDIPNSEDDFYIAGFGPLFEQMVKEIVIQ